MGNTISISDFVRQRRTFNFESELGTFPVTYRPYQMTPAREAEIVRLSSEEVEDETDEDIQSTERGITKIVLQFCEVVEAIGIVGPLHEKTDPITGAGIGRMIIEPGEPIPIKPEVVRFFSSVFIVSVLEGIMKDSRPKSRKTRENLNDI